MSTIVATLSALDPTEGDSGTTVHQDVPASVNLGAAVSTFAAIVGVPVGLVTVTYL